MEEFELKLIFKKEGQISTEEKMKIIDYIYVSLAGEVPEEELKHTVSKFSGDLEFSKDFQIEIGTYYAKGGTYGLPEGE